MIKQYLRWLPAQLGLFNKGAFLLQIDSILKDDVFITSYPKSGNTWLRFIIANMNAQPNEEINFSNLENYVPDIYTSKEVVNAKKKGRIIKTHDALFKYYPKTIYIYRDYRDVIVSFYFFEKSLGNFSGDLLKFMTSDNLKKPFGSWKSHVQSALNFQKENPSKILLISYEGLVQNELSEFKKIANFLNISPTTSYEEIAKRTSFMHLKETEKAHKSMYTKLTNTSFFREGETGNWQAHFEDEHIDLLKADNEVTDLMQKLNYTL